MAFSSSPSQSAEINVTPLIDVLLVLLIIFMVLVPMVPKGLESAVPQDGKNVAADASSPPIIHVTVGASGGATHYRVGERETAFADLRTVIGQGIASQPNHAVFVQADRVLSYGQVAAVLSEARAAGASPVALLPQTKGL